MFRLILEYGTRAFVSFVEAYKKHDCQIVCNLSALDLIGIAHSFGILRIPQMREFNHGKVDLKAFKNRPEITTSTIAFKDPKLEKKRQEKLKAKAAVNLKQNREIENVSDNESTNEKQKKRPKLSEWDELQQDERLLKKFKSGKISKEHLNELL